MEDVFGNRVSVGSPQAMRHYERALDAYLHVWTGVLPALDAALAEAPDFGMARALRALALAGRGLGAQAREEAALARDAVARATERERDHVALVSSIVEGRAPDALGQVIAHAARYPTDLLAASTALGAYGLFAFSGRADHDAARLAFIESIAPHLPDDIPWLIAYRGWSMIEAGRLDEGLELAWRAIAMRPDNGHNAHIVLHGLFERGDADAALAFIADWIPRYPDDAPMWGHLHWHAALAEIASGRTPAAVERLAGPILRFLPVGAPFMGLADLPSLLWRLGLAGVEGLPWSTVREHTARHFPAGANVFGELHLAMVAAVYADRDALAGVVDRLGKHMARGHAGAPVAADWARALDALLAGEREQGRSLLADCVAGGVRLGGSHAQRTVLDGTLAALRVPLAG